MDAPRSSDRTLWTALAIGCVPGVLAAWLSERALEPWDLALAAAALLVWCLLARALPSAMRMPPVPIAIPLTLALVPAALSAGLLETTVSNDEQAYLLQADLFAAGKLSEPLPQPACEPYPGIPGAYAGNCPLHLRQVYESAERGVRFAKYPPGTSLALAPGVAIGVPHAVTAIAGLLDVLLVAAIARRLGLADPARAGLCLALCPFFFVAQTSFQSEVITAPVVLAGYLLLLRAREAPPGSRGSLACAAVGAAAGAVFLARPLTGLVFAVAGFAGLARVAPPARARGLIAAVLGGLPFLALYVGYDALQTGSWWTSPYAAYARRFGPWQAMEPLDVYGRGAVLPSLLDEAGRWSIGLFGILGAAALGFVGLWRLRARDGGAAIALAALGPIAYAFHWYAGHWAYPGPLYGYESLGLLVIGALAVLGGHERFEGALPFAAVLAALALGGYRFHLVREHVALRAAPERAAETAPAGSVVLLPQDDDGAKLYAPSRPPLGQRTVLVREMPTREATSAALERLGLAGRPLYRFAPGAEPGSGALTAVETP